MIKLFLLCSRPTAVNLFDAAQKLSDVADKAAAEPFADSSSVVKTVVDKCEAMLQEDVQANKVASPFDILLNAPVIHIQAANCTSLSTQRQTFNHSRVIAGHRETWFTRNPASIAG